MLRKKTVVGHLTSSFPNVQQLPRSGPVAPQASAFPAISPPSFVQTLKFPEDITKPTIREISMLHGQYTSLLAYAMDRLSKVNVMMLKVQTEIRLRSNEIIREEMRYVQERWKIDRGITVDQKVEDFQNKLDSYNLQKEDLSSRVEIFEKYANALSRELTRRTSEMQVGRNG